MGEREWVLLHQSWEIVSPENGRIQLTFREFQAFLLLATAEGNVKDRGEMLSFFGYSDDKLGYKALESLVYRIRKKTRRIGFPNLVNTAYGLGWTLSVAIRVV